MSMSGMMACQFSALPEGSWAETKKCMVRSKCRSISLLKCCGAVTSLEQKRVPEYFGEKYKPTCFPLWSKWCIFIFA